MRQPRVSTSSTVPLASTDMLPVHPPPWAGMGSSGLGVASAFSLSAAGHLSSLRTSWEPELTVSIQRLGSTPCYTDPLLSVGGQQRRRFLLFHKQLLSHSLFQALAS